MCVCACVYPCHLPRFFLRVLAVPVSHACPPTTHWCRQEQGDTDNSFFLWVTPDCAGTEFETTYRTWFHFGVRGGERGQMIHFTICNMNKQNNLYGHDMRPVTKSMPSRPKWGRVRFACSYSLSDGDFSLRFKHRFEETGEETFFAFCYPQSYEECQQRLRRLCSIHHWPSGGGGASGEATPPDSGNTLARNVRAESKESKLDTADGAPTADDAVATAAEARLEAALRERRTSTQPPGVQTGIYFFRELLTTSKEGRRMDLLTVRGVCAGFNRHICSCVLCCLLRGVVFRLVAFLLLLASGVGTRGAFCFFLFFSGIHASLTLNPRAVRCHAVRCVCPDHLPGWLQRRPTP